ncbi:MAG: hypothetical protein WAO80_08620 [Caldicoprobacterales bacterium]
MISQKNTAMTILLLYSLKAEIIPMAHAINQVDINIVPLIFGGSLRQKNE